MYIQGLPTWDPTELCEERDTIEQELFSLDSYLAHFEVWEVLLFRAEQEGILEILVLAEQQLLLLHYHSTFLSIKMLSEWTKLRGMGRCCWTSRGQQKLSETPSSKGSWSLPVGGQTELSPQTSQTVSSRPFQALGLWYRDHLPSAFASEYFFLFSFFGLR